MTTTMLTAAQPADHDDPGFVLAYVAAAGPRGGDFLIKVDDELEYVEWRGDQFARPWQVRRGFLGTDVAAHSEGATVTIEPSLGSGAGVGFAWHWNFGLGQTIAADGVWSSTDAPPTIDLDPQGFFDTDGAVVPSGLAGTYYAQAIASFTSPTATGFVSVDAAGTTFKTRTPVLYGDGATRMFVVWHELIDLGDEDNTLDVQHFANLTDHDVTLLRVDLRVQRLGATPAAG